MIAGGNFTKLRSFINEPSFSRNFPNSLNYSSLGAIIAHVMLHAFDSNHYNRTLEGDNRNKFNLTQMSVKNFEEKSKCFIKHYGMQKERITNKNGLETLSENIADNDGLKIAHRAYKKWLKSNGSKDIGVLGFEKFTKEQLFFISSDRSYCEFRSKKNLEKEINQSTYIPVEIRTNIALSN
uniref:Peptidase_M13 domain-containing protein n=1 Tax=Strongyloides venezuelensis TaxID=75913 RepID=A0A0K0FNH0_STRVS